ncbi:undecaprenyl/decaprenyl-phosphate alpha-N-acetylglucosaminyl 1-phosphate transferase [Streptomyces sp. XM83C]|uniref:Undecaprenyl/decaprenyl-phosphate alpha-N-acetylglucosaminyl 1-phosphate transferase n=1 Tax=Streptomyces thermocoprophilus TaxID=78356 RepID=A0ABV5VGR4_9ACTN|nr:undecaprenyl/decaprenyl-phosphate alpha-N-acetylglucosaminyl 1-phosphate transferase [Streptomyces sp. XM83C]MCK1819662.1 undecaprenyl/decaprenyl-phosphate alpha-N-acetylglucosaminyl 1-phosphate transferase [Streptomyces sp. XM83C]
MLYGIAAALAALFLSAALAALAATAARRFVAPRGRGGPRPVAPWFGGLAVALATCAVGAAGPALGVRPLGEGTGALLAAGAAVAALGLAADLWRLRSRFLFAGTASAAACVMPYERTGVVGGVLAVLFVAGAALAFRSLDHADVPTGASGAVGVVTAFGVGACAAAEALDGLALLLSVHAAALTGFLTQQHRHFLVRRHRHTAAHLAPSGPSHSTQVRQPLIAPHRPPLAARPRQSAGAALGASGALFTGFLLAASAVPACAGRGPGAGAGVLFALTALPVADVVLVAVSRRRAGRPLLRGGPDHLAHRLRRLGLTAQAVTVLLGAAAFATVAAGVMVHTGRAGQGAVLWVAGGMAAVVCLLLRVNPYGPRKVSNRTHRMASAQVRASLRVRNG